MLTQLQMSSQVLMLATKVTSNGKAVRISNNYKDFGLRLTARYTDGYADKGLILRPSNPSTAKLQTPPYTTRNSTTQSLRIQTRGMDRST